MIAALALFACSEGEPEADGLPVLGDGAHQPGAVDWEERYTDAFLDEPRDLAFHPDAPEQLWIVNRGDHSVTVLHDHADEGSAEHFYDRVTGEHFLAEPAALAFSDVGTFATAHEEDEVTQHDTPEDFMGPTLWTSDVEEFHAGHEGHLDMLHNSPNSVGIAWEAENTFWVYDGYHGALSRYVFNADHGLGGTDHSDGEVYRYVEGELGYQEDIVGHLAYDAASGYLYAADAANSRIVVLDTHSGEEGDRITPNYDGSRQRSWDDADLWTLADAGDGLAQPAGLELHDGHLFVSDHQTGTIHAFDLDGERIDWLETGLPEGSLAGMAFDEAGELYVALPASDSVLWIAPKAE